MPLGADPEPSSLSPQAATLGRATPPPPQPRGSGSLPTAATAEALRTPGQV